MFISARLSIFDYAQDELDLFRTTHEKGLYKPECLSILNDIYKKHYMTENTSNQEIDSIYERVGIQIEKELAILKANFTSSFINKWPLYHFV